MTAMDVVRGMNDLRQRSERLGTLKSKDEMLTAGASTPSAARETVKGTMYRTEATPVRAVAHFIFEEALKYAFKRIIMIQMRCGHTETATSIVLLGETVTAC